LKKTALTLSLLLLIQPSRSAEKKWEVFFTNPANLKKTGTVNPRDGLISTIKNSSKSFYGAFYDISSMEIADGLIAAHKRGIDVKLVTDNNNFSGAAVSKILESGIPVASGNGTGLMHNKFAVIDGSSVFTGSYNTTDNCTLRNNNNAILIRSPELAGIYSSEFQEMFGSGIFGNRKEEGAFSWFTKKYYVKLDDIIINVYFSPEDNIEKIIYDRIKKAGTSVKFMQFSYTSDVIGEMMIKMFKEGIAVEGVFEKKGSDTEYSEYIKMKIESVPVKLDGNKYAMHHKVIIIDDRMVITGSFNISRNANINNDENIIIIESREVAAKYIEEFNRIYGAGVYE